MEGCSRDPARATADSIPAAIPDGMVLIPGGRFAMGSENGYPEEAPVHEVTLVVCHASNAG